MLKAPEEFQVIFPPFGFPMFATGYVTMHSSWQPPRAAYLSAYQRVCIGEQLLDPKYHKKKYRCFMVFHLNDLECYFMSFHVMSNDFS